MAVMKQPKYYDWTQKRPFDDSDSCPFAHWMADPNTPFSFAVHPQGFRIFLRPGEIKALDEYQLEDPYNVAANATSSFHRYRIDVTLKLISLALKEQNNAAPRILDFGCGEGHITSAIKSEFPNAEVSAFDGSLTAIETASRTYPSVDFAVASAYDAPYSQCYFDCVVCNNIYEHIADPMRLLCTVTRGLKPEGYLILSTPSRYRLGNLLRVFAGKPVRLMSAKHVVEYSVGQVIEQLSFYGFKVEATEDKILWPEGIADNPLLRLKRYAERWLAAPVIRAWISISGSHHCLGSTVFFLAVKRE